MNLADLIAEGTIDDGYELVPVKWQKSKDEVREFDILAKREMSGADYEFIYLGAGRKFDSEKGEFVLDENDAVMARRVHRLVKWANTNEHIPEDTARRFKYSLLVAICAALAKVEHPVPNETDVKKN